MTVEPPLPFRRWAATAQHAWDRVCEWRWRRQALLAAILLVALGLRLLDRSTWYWIDEGLSIGISDRSPLGIWRVLRQDGSPPLYYTLLSGWTQVFGQSPGATHALSMIFALACIPVALVATWRATSNERAGWIAAGLTASVPYLAFYANETRMYSLLALETFCLIAGVIEILLGATRRGRIIVGVSTALLLYTHLWAIYLLAGLACAGIAVLWLSPRAQRFRLISNVALPVAGGVIAFLPWVPTVLGQMGDTGAPWSSTPGVRDLFSILGSVLGDERALVVLALVGGAGWLRWLAPGSRQVARWAALFLGLTAIPLTLAWGASQLQPQWAGRYLAITIPPLIILAAIGLARAGLQGLAATALLLIIWIHPLGRLTGAVGSAPLSAKSNVHGLVAQVRKAIGNPQPSDTIVVTHPEQLPLVAWEFGGGFRYANELGVPPDLGVFDWRNVVERLSAAQPQDTLKPLLESIEPGRHLVLLQPQLPSPFPGQMPEWLALFRVKSIEWKAFVDADSRFRLVTSFGHVETPANRTPLTAYIYERTN